MDAPKSLANEYLLCMRGDLGEIIAVAKTEAVAGDYADGWQRVATEASEVQAFLLSLPKKSVPLEASDARLIRILEDLIEILIRKRVVCLSDFPEAAQVKLLERFIERTDTPEQIELSLTSQVP